MPLIAKDSPTATFDPVPVGTHLAVSTALVDLGTQHEQTPEGPRDMHKIMVIWELPDETFEKDGRQLPMSINKEYTMSLSEKANLRKDLIGWRGVEFTPEQLAGFDIRNILGKACLLNVVHKKSAKGKMYARVAGIAPLMKGQKAPPPSQLPIAYDTANGRDGVYKNLPEWIQKKINACVEFNQSQAQPSTEDEYVDSTGAAEEAVPF